MVLQKLPSGSHVTLGPTREPINRAKCDEEESARIHKPQSACLATEVVLNQAQRKHVQSIR